MKVSVIIPTYNGRQKIGTLLESLEEQSYKDFDIVVVVDGSTDGTVELLKQWQARQKKLRVLVQENKGRAGARNAGARVARSELLIFFDDDVQVHPECVREHLDHHASNPRSLAGGRVVSKATTTSLFSAYKHTVNAKWERPFFEIEGAVNQIAPFFAAANFSIPKSLFDDLQGFNEGLADAEDQELAIRADLKGIPIYFLKKAVGRHVDHTSVSEYVKRLQQYRKAHLELQKMYPQEARVAYYARPALIKMWIYRFLSHPGWLRLAEAETFLKFIPRRLRHKYFDLVTTSHGIYYSGHK